ncbi:MAG: phosphotransferase family protein [Eubacteriales bacterium]
MMPEEIIAKRAHKTIYRDGDATVKVFDETFNKSDVLREALNHACVEETGLPVPSIIEVSRIDGKWAIATRFIEGTTLSALMKAHPEKIDEYLNLFVDLQLTIQSKTSPKLNKLRDKMLGKITQTDLPADVKYELHTRLESMPNHEKLCHGDFNPSNIIIQANGSPVVIDWAHATVGNASADAARTFLLFSLHKNTDIAEKYMNLFCEKSHTARKYVDQWLPIVAASQMVKGNPEEREFLQNWVNIVDYQ